VFNNISVVAIMVPHLGELRHNPMITPFVMFRTQHIQSFTSSLLVRNHYLGSHRTAEISPYLSSIEGGEMLRCLMFEGKCPWAFIQTVFKLDVLGSTFR
jgi:hypothetical protein